MQLIQNMEHFYILKSYLQITPFNKKNTYLPRIFRRRVLRLVVLAPPLTHHLSPADRPTGPRVDIGGQPRQILQHCVTPPGVGHPLVRATPRGRHALVPLDVDVLVALVVG